MDKRTKTEPLKPASPEAGGRTKTDPLRPKRQMVSDVGRDAYKEYLKEYRRKMRELLWIQYGDPDNPSWRYEDDYE